MTSGIVADASGIVDTAAPTVAVAWNSVMCSVRAVGKDEWNDQQKFLFRGVDAVVNAVGPALREHGVTVIADRVRQVSVTEYETRPKNPNVPGTRMVNRVVHVKWRIYGPSGDWLTGESFGESADSGDKSMSKALSVAYRTFLLQALCIPTGERDPDMDVHERQSHVSEEAIADANEARGEVLAKMTPFGWDANKLIAKFREMYGKNLLEVHDVDLIRGFGDTLAFELRNKPPVPAPDKFTPASDGEPRQGNREPETGTNHPGAAPSEKMITDAQLRKLHALLSADRITDHDERVDWCSDMIGRRITSTKELTAVEASKLIDKMEPKK